MTRSALVLTAALAACSSGPPATNDTASSDPAPVPSAAAPAPRPSATAAPTATPTPAPARVSATLPAALTGRWAASPDQCGPASELGITIEPTRIIYFENDARITRVTALPDGTLGVDAAVSGDGDEPRQPRSFDLKLSADGNQLRRVEAPRADITYTRCKG